MGAGSELLLETATGVGGADALACRGGRGKAWAIVFDGEAEEIRGRA